MIESWSNFSIATQIGGGRDLLEPVCCRDVYRSTLIHHFLAVHGNNTLMDVRLTLQGIINDSQILLNHLKIQSFLRFLLHGVNLKETREAIRTSFVRTAIDHLCLTLGK